MRILYTVGREIGYERNDVLLRAFRRFSDVDIVGMRSRPNSLVFSSFGAAARLLPHLIHGSNKYDLLFVGFYGYLILRLVGNFPRIPVLFDAFVSNFDTLCGDRHQCRPSSLLGKIARWLDRSACLQANTVLLDTPLHIQYFREHLGLQQTAFHSIPVGCNEDIFKPQINKQIEQQRWQSNDVRIITTYSSYLPIHGVDIIIRAAALLKARNVHFRIIGNGPTYSQCRDLSAKLQLENISFLPPVPRETLAQEIAKAHLCLAGHFGTTEKANRVVPGKLYQMLAVGRPVIAGATSANRWLLQDSVHALLVPPGRPDLLADAIRRLCDDPYLRQNLADAGRQQFRQRASEAVITEQLRAIVKQMLART